MENKKLPSFVPLGIDLDNILKTYVTLLGIGVANSYQFFHSLERYLTDIQYIFAETGEIPTEFTLFAIYFLGLGFFSIVFLWCFMMIGYHYYYHLHGSKSLYLMKRLPRKGEFLRRVVILPFVLSVVTFFYVLLVLTYYLYIYRAMGMLHDGQWELLLLLFK